MEAVQEFQVLTSGYQAEYGRASGGVVNVITKTGDNALHGSVFGFLRHRSFDATNTFSAVKDPPYTRTQHGASVGGSLRANRTFFFASF
jgi:outer membrane receptor for ferrienterochelin and colicin